ncbi:hypothetical protein IEO21_07835 [Rhodonia placenta]|uniref:Uncharacterized protein n=1 Tax=Rhodonia placenta TaxID=104341 RepID=A0A8H7TZA5_9APHY|nr:hypothetical protein IEO21_07835 [Postia placenta]
MTARDVCTVRDCLLRASLRPWTNAPPRHSHRCSNIHGTPSSSLTRNVCAAPR